VLLFAFPFFVFWISGEFVPIPTIITQQQGSAKDMLVLSSFNGDNGTQYKSLSAAYKNPEIMVLGTSRTLTMRSVFFKDPNIFYNAGQAIRNGNGADLSLFLNKLPVKSNLKVLLLDLTGFREKGSLTGPWAVHEGFFSVIHTLLTTGWRQVYQYYFAGDFSIDQLLENRNNTGSIGLNALVHHMGFRKDGSMERGDISAVTSQKTALSAVIDSEVENIPPGKGFFEYEGSLSPQDVKNLGTFLDLCKARGIYVIGYMPPFASKIFSKFESLSGLYGDSFRQAPIILSSLFKKYNYPVYDLRRLSDIGSNDTELYDPGHITERGMLRLLSYLAMHESSLKTYVDVSVLRSKIAQEQ
jgi:hypothetical protein